MQRYTLLTALALAVSLTYSIHAADEAAPTQGPRSAQADQLERALAADSEALYTYWPAQFYVGGKVGTERSLGEVNIMAPVWQHDTGSLYVDLRSRFDDHDSQEYNLGGGYRHILNKDMILGAYGFFDVLNSENNNTFLQGLVGAELLMEDWRFRGNWYIPQDKEETLATTGGARFAEVRGNSIVVVTPATFELTERSLGGFDLEVGRRFPVFRNDLWVYAAYFNFHEDGYPRIEGPRLRAEYLIPLGPIDVLPEGSHAIIGGEWQHDNVRGSQAFATFGIRIPLGSDPKEAPPKMSEDWKYWAMISRVQRDIDIVTGETTSQTVAESLEAARNPVNPANPRYSGIYYADPAGGGGATGTELDPQDIDTAANNANTAVATDGFAGVGADGIVGVLVVNGNNSTAGISVANNGTLVSGGETIMVADAMGTQFPLAILGGFGTITGTDVGSNTVTVANGADNVLIQGGLFTGTGIAAISGTNNDNLNFSRFVVNNFTGNGIYLDGVGELNMTGLAAEPTNFGIGNTSGTALTLVNGTGTRTLSDFIILTPTGIGLQLGDAIAGPNAGATNATNLTIQDSGVAALAILNSAETATFTDSTITQDDVGSLLSVVGDSSTVTFNNTTLDATNGTGIIMDTADGVYNFNSAVVLNNTVGGATANATFSADSSSGDVTFSDLTINTPDSDAAVAIGIGQSGGAPGNAVAGSFTFNDLTITATNTAGFVADDSHNITVAGPSSIVSTGAAALNLTNLTGVDMTFNAVSSTGSAGNGININNVTGTGVVVDTTTTVANAAGVGISVVNTPADVSFTDAVISTDGATGFLANNVGSLTVNGASSITTANGTALDLTDVTNANMTFNAVSSTNAAGMGISLNNVASTGASVGVVVDTTTTVTNAAGVGISVVDTTADVSFTDAVISTDGATGLVANNIGNFTIDGTSSITTTNGAAMSLTGVTGANIVFDTVSSTDSGAAGITLNNVDGTQVAVNTTTTVNNAATNAISVVNSNVDTTFNGLAVDTTGADAIVLTNNDPAGTITFDGGTIANVTGNVMTAQNPGTVVFNNITADTGITGNGIAATATNANTAAITITNSTFDATVNDAINISTVNSATIVALITGNTLTGDNTVVGRSVNTSGIDITVTGNTFNATTAALDLSTVNVGVVINTDVTGNTVNSGTFELSAGAGTTINFTNADQPSLSTDNDNVTVNDAAAGGTLQFNQPAPATP